MVQPMTGSGGFRFVALAAAIGLLSAIAPPARAACDQCEDLCKLVDEYQQSQLALILFSQYARNNPLKISPPASVTDANSMETYVEELYNRSLAGQSRPCPIKGGGGAASTRLTTSIVDCKIRDTKGNELKGQAKTDFENQWDCKPFTDSLHAHEVIHKSHCDQAYARTAPDRAAGLAIQDTPENVAESEVQAYRAGMNELIKGIRDILAKNKGCGWDPTIGQKANPNSVPSTKQMQDMQK